jgi:hypothetical protein
MGLLQRETGVDEGSDHQPVPIRQDFVVEAGADPASASGKQFLAQRCEPFLVLYVAR